jgi:hypothetical protein
MYHTSSKNSGALHESPKLLEIRLLKSGRFLSTEQVASNVHSVSAVWENFEDFVQHFEKAENDTTRDKKR